MRFFRLLFLVPFFTLIPNITPIYAGTDLNINNKLDTPRRFERIYTHGALGQPDEHGISNGTNWRMGGVIDEDYFFGDDEVEVTWSDVFHLVGPHAEDLVGKQVDLFVQFDSDDEEFDFEGNFSKKDEAKAIHRTRTGFPRHFDYYYLLLEGSGENFVINSYRVILWAVHSKVVPNGKNPGPAWGEEDSPEMIYDPLTRELSFTDAVINFANLVGDTSLDESFEDDPIIGSTVTFVKNFERSPLEETLLFLDGQLEVRSSDDILLAEATIPSLLIDETFPELGINLWGELDFTNINTTESAFLELYANSIIDNPNLPAELFGTIPVPVADRIKNEEFVTETVDDFTFGQSDNKNRTVPEPSSIVGLLTIGGIALGASKKKQG